MRGQHLKPYSCPTLRSKRGNPSSSLNSLGAYTRSCVQHQASNTDSCHPLEELELHDPVEVAKAIEEDVNHLQVLQEV